MDRVSLTKEYLAEVAASGATAAELVGSQPESKLLNGLYQGRYLSRPLFLGHQEQTRLAADLENMRTALVSLPDRLFGGDLAAFARAVGMTDLQVSAILRSRGASVTRQARADMYADATGMRLLEFNMGSTLGGMDNADMCRALLDHPVLADYAERRGLTYVDTMREQVNNMFVESGFEPGSRPVVALTDWPSSFENLAPYMEQFCERWQAMGLDAHPCHIGQLDVRDGAVWLGARRVDIISRMFLIEDLLESGEAPSLMDPVLDAAHRGEVKIFTPMDSELFASKGALAMLSDEANRGLFTEAELASLDRILPWTRMVRRGEVTLEDGERVDLVEYALAHQEDLALKPTLLHGGHGVLLGWSDDVSPELWREQLTGALDGPYVIQRRVVPEPELFPDAEGQLRQWTVAWGVFTVVNGYGGAMARATTVESGEGVVNVANGAHAGAVLHEAAPAAAAVEE
ncbi:hypothetical protein [Streptomyces sp. ISL-100]|uniref:hypothetical protein n=1 Tax=Streptomyces sp. ISL-100 TaxID=2819173 RepID=UPI001BED2947|nr:hypothetical protein [Streptomyces sp. ISL-100]MBT2396903.1 hypothetical protein [Streptomyces sp. ISL-100]